jgi:outer membrane protein assembly factor BamB
MQEPAMSVMDKTLADHHDRDRHALGVRAAGKGFSRWALPLASILSLVAIALLCPAATAQEWTRFRGPNGSGQSEATTIPTVWKPAEELWKVELPGAGNSSPVLWGDRIFLLSANPEDGTRYIHCHSAIDGKLLWQRDYPSETHHIHQFNTLASSTPAVDDKRVYCAWSTPEEFTLLALTHDGEPVWKANLGPFVSQHGFGTSPIVYQDLVIIANDQDAESFAIAVSAADGTTRWKVDREHLPAQNTAYSTPCLYHPEGRPAELILCSRVHGVTSLDPLTGELRWEKAGIFAQRPVSSPIVVDGRVLATCGQGSGNNNLVALLPYAEGNEPKLEYQVDKTNAPYVPSLVAKGNLVFLWGDRGIVSCMNGTTGEILWRKRVGGDFFGSPIRVADTVYCISTEGDVVAVKAAEEFELLGKSPLGETARSTPAVAGGRMFLRSEKHLTAVGQR